MCQELFMAYSLSLTISDFYCSKLSVVCFAMFVDLDARPQSLAALWTATSFNFLLSFLSLFSISVFDLKVSLFLPLDSSLLEESTGFDFLRFLLVCLASFLVTEDLLTSLDSVSLTTSSEVDILRFTFFRFGSFFIEDGLVSSFNFLFCGFLIFGFGELNFFLLPFRFLSLLFWTSFLLKSFLCLDLEDSLFWVCFFLLSWEDLLICLFGSVFFFLFWLLFFFGFQLNF